MREYLIEVPHSPEECTVAPVEAADDRTGLRAYRGCSSGTHTTWIIAELAAEHEAWGLVPTLLRDTARVVAVERSEPDPAIGTPQAGGPENERSTTECARDRPRPPLTEGDFR